MNDVFEVGEIAILKNLVGPFERMNGQEVEVVANMTVRKVVDIVGTKAEVLAYQVNLRGWICCVYPFCLKKKPRPAESKDADFGKTVEWQDCAWQPELTVA